jgi:2-keto-4-pentenoate hydratase
MHRCAHSRRSRSADNGANTVNYGLPRSAAAGLAACFVLCACVSLQQRTADEIFIAWQAQSALPLAHRIDETLTIESAYRVQHAFVQRRLDGAQPAGFKGGLTSPAAQARFGASGPIAGVLIVGPSQTPATLQLSKLRGLNIETEVGMRVGRAITQKLRDIDDLRQHIDGIGPAVELPNLDYETPAQLTTPDIVASNVAAAYFLVGEFVPASQRDPNAANPRLACDGKEVNVGQAREALGDQWQAALWLVNTMIEQGWRIEPGQILMTGALGRMIPARPGHCRADYGDWGYIEVDIAA